MRKILGSLWFTEMGNPASIGVVLVETEFGNKAYIGTGHGFSQEADEQKIAQTGAKFPIQAANKLFGVEEQPWMTSE